MSSIIITWWKPKAEYAGFKTFPEEHKNKYEIIFFPFKKLKFIIV